MAPVTMHRGGPPPLGCRQAGFLSPVAQCSRGGGRGGRGHAAAGTSGGPLAPALALAAMRTPVPGVLMQRARWCHGAATAGAPRQSRRKGEAKMRVAARAEEEAQIHAQVAQAQAKQVRAACAGAARVWRSRGWRCRGRGARARARARSESESERGEQ